MPPTPDIAAEVESARRAQPAWGRTPLRGRLRVIRQFRHLIAVHARELVEAVETSRRRRPGETLSAEVVPLADACRFLERRARRILAVRRPKRSLRPFWLFGARAEIRREPHGVVLIIGPANYPLFLPGVQALQALAAGNTVALKPGRGGLPAAQALARLLERAGLDAGLLRVLPESVEAAQGAIAAGVDKVVLTGSAATGRAVARQLAADPRPATFELSGCDAVFVLPGADVDLVVRALLFGIRLNEGATCIAPRRVFVVQPAAPELDQALGAAASAEAPSPVEPALAAHVRELVEDAMAAGARLVAGKLDEEEVRTPVILADASADMELLKEDVAVPLLSLVRIGSEQEALAADAECPYALGASVFGPPRAARRLAARVRAGVVVVNDMIAPTADPRLSFGGRGRSGFGVTRGAEGLLEMTVPKAIITRRGSWRPHMDEPDQRTGRLIGSYLEAAHGPRLAGRLKAWFGLIRAMMGGGPKPRDSSREGAAR
jgi:acyl-CoA reductase-like NAD-dependent aldehyde dehydrogenase